MAHRVTEAATEPREAAQAAARGSSGAATALDHPDRMVPLAAVASGVAVSPVAARQAAAPARRAAAHPVAASGAVAHPVAASGAVAVASGAAASGMAMDTITTIHIRPRPPTRRQQTHPRHRYRPPVRHRPPPNPPQLTRAQPTRARANPLPRPNLRRPSPRPPRRRRRRRPRLLGPRTRSRRSRPKARTRRVRRISRHHRPRRRRSSRYLSSRYQSLQRRRSSNPNLLLRNRRLDRPRAPSPLPSPSRLRRRRRPRHHRPYGRPNRSRPCGTSSSGSHPGLCYFSGPSPCWVAGRSSTDCARSGSDSVAGAPGSARRNARY